MKPDSTAFDLSAAYPAGSDFGGLFGDLGFLSAAYPAGSSSACVRRAISVLSAAYPAGSPPSFPKKRGISCGYATDPSQTIFSKSSRKLLTLRVFPEGPQKIFR